MLLLTFECLNTQDQQAKVEFVGVRRTPSRPGP